MLYDRPVRELLVDAVEVMPEVFRRAEVVEWFAENYPSVRPATVTAHITAATVNSRSRPHYPAANQHLIFQRADRRLERYRPSRHGHWDDFGVFTSGTAPRVDRATRAGPTTSSNAPPIDSGRLFEAHARRVLGRLWGVELRSAVVELAPGVAHQFDLVSHDARIVGDAKWYKNIATPAAKWSVIAEYVWLLQRASADRRFLVFGQDRDVPERWLARFRPLIGDVAFYFLGDDGALTRLA